MLLINVRHGVRKTKIVIIKLNVIRILLKGGRDKMKKAFIDIKGMDCASDAVEIERSLLKVKGVRSASVNYLIHEGFVNVDNSVTEEKLISAVKKTGHDVKNIRFEQEKK